MAQLHYENKKPYLESQQKKQGYKEAQNLTYAVSPNSTIETGLNNPLIENIYFEFSMMNYQTGRLLMTDNNTDRYSIPESVVNKPGHDTNMRLEMLGFELS